MSVTRPARTRGHDEDIDVRDRIVNRYAKEGFDSIDPADLRGRFRSWGLYTQRAPGTDGARTGVLAPEELADAYFMMRVRMPGGRLTSEQLRAVAHVATTYGRDLADITDRQNVQFHWLRIEDVPAAWEVLEAVGLSSTEARGDQPRSLRGCPLAGIDADEVIDATPQLAATGALAQHDDDFSDLPRKYTTVISGCAAHCVDHELNDVSFVGVRRDEREVGYDLWVGGGLSTSPMLAQRLGAFVAPGLVPEVWAGVTRLFRDHGYRLLGDRARLKFLVADWGPEKFRKVLEKDYLGHALPDGPPPAPPRDGARDHVGVHAQKDGRYSVGFAPSVGRTSGTRLGQVADLADRYGSGRVHATVDRKMVVVDVPEPDVAVLVTELEERDLRVRPSAFRRGTVACTGIEFCKLGVVETKARAQDLFGELERRLPDFDQPITISLTGCPSSCVRQQVADIGLKGSVVEGGEGFQVHLGGSLGADPSFGRKLRGVKVTADELPDYVERLLRRYLADRADGEQFAAWSRRADEGLLT